jgi:hypothetical protein
MQPGKMVEIAMLVSLVGCLGGCAVGQKIRYSDVSLALAAEGNQVVAVSTHDNRSYVKDGEKKQTYIGTLRGGYGNPFDVTTESAKPLAFDMNGVMCASLKNKGYVAVPVVAEPQDLQEQIVDKLKASKADRMLLLTLTEWRSDTYVNTSLYYDLHLLVMNNQGDKLAEASAKGEDDLGGSFWNPPSHAKEAVPIAYKKRLELLLNDPSVVDSLK